MKPTVYVETTIPSYLVARPSKLPRLQADQATTRQWWSQHASDFDMFVSDIVIREMRRGDAAMAEERLAKITRLPVLALSDAAENLAALLLERVIPPQAIDDAAHIAIAAVNRMDFSPYLELSAHQQPLHDTPDREVLRSCRLCLPGGCHAS